MGLLKDLPLDKLTAARLWSALDPPIRTLAAQALFDGDRSIRNQADHAIAIALRFRDAGVRKLSVDRRIGYLVRVVRPDDELASSLLMALHLGCRQELLSAFLDELQIPNEDGLIDSDHEVSPVTTEHLERAVAKLRERFDKDDVELYLASLLVLDPNTWDGLTTLLQPDASEAPPQTDQDR